MITPEDAKKGLINDQMEKQLESLSAQVEANLERSRNAWAEWRAVLSDSSTRAMESADSYAHRSPWQLATGAALVGVVLGVLCARDCGR